MAEKELKQKCFVIMPFSKTSDKHTEEYWTDHFEEFIKPLIQSSHPIIAERSSPLREDIIRQIITNLVTIPIVVADLTDANPNVYWELGVRQSFKHCTITIAEKGTTLPFDVGGKGSLFYYPNNHIKMPEFERKFHNALDDCLKNPGVPDSHVLETISGRGTLYQILMRDESLRRLNALLSEIERNTKVLERVINICKENSMKRKEGENIEYPANRFSKAAIEYLVVSRYLSANEVFYKIAEDYLDLILSFNDVLPLWVSNPNNIESWLTEENVKFKQQIGIFTVLVLGQKRILETIL